MGHRQSQQRACLFAARPFDKAANFIRDHLLGISSSFNAQTIAASEGVESDGRCRIRNIDKRRTVGLAAWVNDRRSMLAFCQAQPEVRSRSHQGAVPATIDSQAPCGAGRSHAGLGVAQASFPRQSVHRNREQLRHPGSSEHRVLPSAQSSSAM